jgi:hypothetical protein
MIPSEHILLQSVVLYGYKSWSHPKGRTQIEDAREEKLLRRISGRMRERRELYGEEL